MTVAVGVDTCEARLASSQHFATVLKKDGCARVR